MSSEEALMPKVKKDSSIRVRLGESMFSHLCKRAKEENKTVSQVMREIIEKNMETGKSA